MLSKSTPPHGASRRPRASAPRGLPAASAVARIAVAVAAALGLPSVALAQQESPDDWPCAQVLVPEVAVGTLWPVPIEAADAADWRQDAEVAGIAERYAGLEEGDADARAEADAAFEAFLGGVPEAEREARLGRLAAGTAELVNSRRSDYIDGIRRFTRQQIRSAERLETLLNEQALRDADAGPGADAISLARAQSGEATDPAMQTLRWQERLYDQREHQVRALCGRPVRLEEDLAASLRTFAQALPPG